MSQYHHLIFDGTFIHRPLSLVAIMDANSYRIISGGYDVRESSERQLTLFFQSLKNQGLQPNSFTVDGNPQVIRAIRMIWPEIIIQRCLVHIQRQGLSWCRSSPKTVSARKLRILFLQVSHIETSRQRDQFSENFTQWEQKYGQDIQRKPGKGYVFSDIKRARSMLLKALPSMFYYLEDSRITSNTNGLEGYFSRLKGHYRQHRGLTKSKLENYFEWYLFLNPK